MRFGRFHFSITRDCVHSLGLHLVWYMINMQSLYICPSIYASVNGYNLYPSTCFTHVCEPLWVCNVLYSFDIVLTVLCVLLWTKREPHVESLWFEIRRQHFQWTSDVELFGCPCWILFWSLEACYAVMFKTKYMHIDLSLYIYTYIQIHIHTCMILMSINLAWH